MVSNFQIYEQYLLIQLGTIDISAIVETYPMNLDQAVKLILDPHNSNILGRSLLKLKLLIETS